MRGLVFPTTGDELQHDSWDGGWSDKRETKMVDKKPVVTVREGWKTIAGIERQVRFHDLRHTCASHLVMGAWGQALTLYEVRDWMGHSSITVTQRYAHLSPDSIHGAARQMRNLEHHEG